MKGIRGKIYAPLFVAVVIIIWQIIGMCEIMPAFMLPTPTRIMKALITDWEIIAQNLLVTLCEATIGMVLAIVFSFVMAVVMDRIKILHDIFYPVCVVSQTVPTMAIAPILVLWLGFGMMPKIALVFLTCFFPLIVSLLSGFETSDKNILRLYRLMNASYLKILFDVKIPYALESFFAGLKISVSYSVVGAVIAEWLGGDGGLGVYMTRVREGYEFDKMFAVIIVISALSLLLMKLVDFVRVKSMPWKR